jgi:hypothetical protein
LKTDLSQYDNSWYHTGAGRIKRSVWFVVNALFFLNPLNPSSGIKVAILRWFGAKIGTGVMIKPGVNIKYPWRLSIGNYTWIGEKVWIDNLDQTTIRQPLLLVARGIVAVRQPQLQAPNVRLDDWPHYVGRWGVARCPIGGDRRADVWLPFRIDRQQRGHQKHGPIHHLPRKPGGGCEDKKTGRRIDKKIQDKRRVNLIVFPQA